MRTRLIVAGLLIAGVAVAACGSADAANSTATATTVTQQVPVTTTETTTATKTETSVQTAPPVTKTETSVQTAPPVTKTETKTQTEVAQVPALPEECWNAMNDAVQAIDAYRLAFDTMAQALSDINWDDYVSGSINMDDAYEAASDAEEKVGWYNADSDACDAVLGNG